jgi:hypothetical protein
MPITDFLSEGAPIPAGSAVTATTTQNVLPDWYTNYAMGILGGQRDIAAAGYVPYDAAHGGGPRLADFTPLETQGMNAAATAASAYAPGLAKATGAAENLYGASALDAANPMLNRAGATSVANIGQYMNPYMDQVVNRIGDVAARNLREKFLPEISDKFVSAGQFGGTRQAEIMGRTLRDLQESTLAEQNKAMMGGYNTALTASGEDLTRFGNVGTAQGNLATADITSGLNAAKTGAELAGSAQSMGLTGAGALTTAGAAQRDMDQKNLDIRLADWMKQQGFDQDQIDKQMAALKGVSGAVPTAVQKVGIEPLGTQPASGLASAGSALTGLAGIVGDLRDMFGNRTTG